MDDEIVDNQDGSVSILRHMKNVQITRMEEVEPPHIQKLQEDVANPYSEWFDKQRLMKESQWRNN